MNSQSPVAGYHHHRHHPVRFSGRAWRANTNTCNNNQYATTLSRFSCNIFPPHLPLSPSLPGFLPRPPRFLLPCNSPRLLLRFRSPSSSPLLSSMTQAASPGSPHSPPSKTVRVEISGRVQGVFYRDWTVENANQLGLKGWVRNKRDGSVEALFSGEADKVHEMEQRCRRGPPAAMVTGFNVFPCNDDPGTRFVRKSTA